MTPEISEIIQRLRETKTERTYDSVGRAYDYPKELPILAADALQQLSEHSAQADSYHKFWIEERDKRIRAEANHKDVVETKRITDIRLKWALAGLQRIYNEATENRIVEIAGEAFEEATHERPRGALVSGSTEGGNG